MRENKGQARYEAESFPQNDSCRGILKSDSAYGWSDDSGREARQRTARMSANDAIVLRANFEDWKTQRQVPEKVDAWLYYAVEQFIKEYALDDDEIMYGITDSGNDGGADAIYFLVNHRQLVKAETTLEAKNVSKVKLIIIQSKASGGFKPTEIEKWLELSDDFLDLSKPADGFGARYNSKVVTIMRTWKEKYIKIAGAFPEVSIEYFYVTGDDAVPDDYAIDAGRRVKERVAKHLSKAKCDVHYVGAKELWEQAQRRPPKSKTLAWAEQPMQAAEGTVGLVRLSDYFAFIQDADGVLAERIFDSNVRGYQFDTTVNEAIQNSLAKGGAANFWLLNNGVTIISPNATPASHLHLSITDPQIVNGLQTSREIFSYCSDKARFNPEKDKRTVLVRVIQTEDPALQDMIIRATNSQNRMGPGSLRMTDQIHRNIEEFFKKFDLYYDRRKGFYRDQAKPIKKIVSATEVAQAVISVILQKPDDARARPGDFFKDDDKYNKVFGDAKIGLDGYLSCVKLLRRIDRYLDAKSPFENSGQ